MKELLHTLLQIRWTTVVIWYAWYEKIIVNTPLQQVVNKNSIITSIYVFVFVTVIIIVLTISKGIFLLVQFNSFVA